MDDVRHLDTACTVTGRQEDVGFTVGEHETQALCRESRIQWHVRTPRLMYAQYRNDQVRGTLEAQADIHAGADADMAQTVGQPIRTCIERPVAEHLTFKRDGGCTWGLSRLPLELNKCRSGILSAAMWR